MYQTRHEPPPPADDSSDESSMPPLMNPRSYTSSDSSAENGSVDGEPDAFDSPNKPGPNGHPFGHTTPDAIPDMLLAELLLNTESTMDVFSSADMIQRQSPYVDTDGDLNGRRAHHVFQQVGTPYVAP